MRQIDPKLLRRSAAIGLVGAAISLGAHAQDGDGFQPNSPFNSVGAYGAIVGFELEPEGQPTLVDDSGAGFGVTASKSLIGPYFASLEYQIGELDNTEFRSAGGGREPLSIDRWRIGFGAHSRLTDPLIGFWRFEYQAIEYSPVADQNGNPQRDNEDGFGAHLGGIYRVLPRLELTGSLGYLGLDEMQGAEAFGGISVPVLPSLSLEGSARYTLLEDNDDDRFGVYSLRLGASFRFGGPTVYRMIAGKPEPVAVSTTPARVPARPQRAAPAPPPPSTAAPRQQASPALANDATQERPEQRRRTRRGRNGRTVR